MLAQSELGLPLPQISLVHRPQEDQTLFSATFLVGPIPVSDERGVGREVRRRRGPELQLRPRRHALQLDQQPRRSPTSRASVQPYANAGVCALHGRRLRHRDRLGRGRRRGRHHPRQRHRPGRRRRWHRRQPEADTRPLSRDLAAIARATPLLAPTQYQFSLKYDYGARSTQGLLEGRLGLGQGELPLLGQDLARHDRRLRQRLLAAAARSSSKVSRAARRSGGARGRRCRCRHRGSASPSCRCPRARRRRASAGGLRHVAGREGLLRQPVRCDKPGTSCFRNDDCCPSRHGPARASPIRRTAAPRAAQGCRQDQKSCNTSADCCAGEAVGCYPSSDTPGSPKVLPRLPRVPARVQPEPRPVLRRPGVQPRPGEHDQLPLPDDSAMTSCPCTIASTASNRLRPRRRHRGGGRRGVPEGRGCLDPSSRERGGGRDGGQHGGARARVDRGRRVRLRREALEQRGGGRQPAAGRFRISRASWW